MGEPLYVLCVRVPEPDEWVRWQAARLDDRRFLTRAEVEDITARMGAPIRMAALAKTEDGRLTQLGEHFERHDNVMTGPGESLWGRAMPPDHDMRALFRDSLTTGEHDALPSPEPDRIPVPVPTVLRLAGERYGASDELESAIDNYVMNNGGRRYLEEGLPEIYLLPADQMGLA